MKRKELDALKASILEKKEKANDMDIVISEILTLPPGQLKKVLTEPVLAVFAKYGYTGE